MSRRIRVEAGRRTQASWLACIALAAVAGGGCTAGNAGNHGDASQPSTTSTGVRAAGTCNAQAVADALKIDRRQAEALRAQQVTFCEVRTDANRAQTFETNRTIVGDLGGHDFVPLIVFENAPLPSGCDVSTDTRLFIVVESKWVEARNVGCGGDS